MPHRFCYQCKKRIRTNSSSAIYLGFLIANPKGNYEAWVCNKRCENAYSPEEED